MPGAGQREFDHLVQELLQQGIEWHDAVEEILATFVESNLDIGGLYIYHTQAEWEEKQKANSRIATIEKCAEGREAFVNVSFALQGLQQVLRSNDSKAHSTLIMAENRRVFHSLMKILMNLAKEDDCNEMEDNIDSESDDEDDEKNLQRLALLEFTLLFLQRDSRHFRCFNEMIKLVPEEAGGLKGLLESLADDTRISELALDLLWILVQVEENRELIKQVGIVSELDLIKKMHKKSDAVQSKVAACLSFV